MSLFKYFFIVVRNFIRNFHYLGEYDLFTRFKEHEPIEYSDFRQSVLQCKKQIISNYYNMHPLEAEKYNEELNYLNSVNLIDPFPYPTIKKIPEVHVEYDSKKSKVFVIHNGKKMYLPKGWSKETASKYYLRFIERENILGGDFTTKTPHQYQSNQIHVDNGDIIIDAGAAEGLFALDVIEKAKFVYLFEVDEVWIDALKATFEPYKDKVSIISKYLSGVDSKDCTTLSSVLPQTTGESYFIKMDIEGEEENVLRACETFLQSSNKIKVSCCTYHRADHEKDIPLFLKSHGFQTEFSDGFMVFYWDSNLNIPYFRKGLVRAVRN